jgi:hypothetical protein
LVLAVANGFLWHSFFGNKRVKLFVMKEERNRKDNTRQSDRNIDTTTGKSGLHVQNPPKGAKATDSNFSNPAPDQEKGNSSRYANSSDNEE